MKKLTILFTLLTLSVGLWAVTQNVSYLSPVYNTEGVATSGIKEWQSISVEATVVTNASYQVTWTAGWYVVTGTDVTLSNGAVCNGAVHLILADGAKLTATGPTTYAGIQVSGDGNSLTIYAQSTGEQSGQLIANGGNYAAGIGGGNKMDGSNITINGGIVTANGGIWAAGIGGGDEGSGSNITINGGIVTATGGSYAAGIGGGYQGSGSNITINGGTVIATGEYNGAGIGGGDRGSGSNITINGGTVTATGGSYGAGIGGGDSGSGSNITINGGVIEATGGEKAAGIGGGDEGSGSNITINGGTVTATGGEYAAGIGGGREGSGSDITINDGEVIATGGENAAGIGGGYKGNGSNITISGGTVTATGGSYGAGIGGGLNSYSASDIFVATSLVVKAGDSPNPTDEIAKTRTATTDIASDLAGKQYVTAKYDLAGCKDRAIAEINAAINGVTDENIIAIADKAKTDINAATTKEGVDAIKVQALADIDLAKYKADAVAEIDAAVVGVTNEDILAIANKAKEDINAAETEEAVNPIKTFALTKISALVLIQTAREGIQNTNLNNWIEGAINDIQNGGPDATPGIDEIKNQILTVIHFFKDGKAEGDAAGYTRGKTEGLEEGKAAGIEEGDAAGYARGQAEALGAMGTPCTDCTAVEVTDGTTTVKLYKPTKVRYIKVPSEE